VDKFGQANVGSRLLQRRPLLFQAFVFDLLQLGLGNSVFFGDDVIRLPDLQRPYCPAC